MTSVVSIATGVLAELSNPSSSVPRLPLRSAGRIHIAISSTILIVSGAPATVGVAKHSTLNPSVETAPIRMAWSIVGPVPELFQPVFSLKSRAAKRKAVAAAAPSAGVTVSTPAEGVRFRRLGKTRFP